MLRFTLLGFPVGIHWMFWVSMALLGGATSSNTPEAMQALLGWIVVGFLSILIHELGHALTMRHYGDRQVGIILYGFGGQAQGSRHLTRQESFWVSAAGPFTQIAAAVVLWWLTDLWTPDQALLRYMLRAFINISLFWAVLNLLPIYPLDGGHISMSLFGPMRLRQALILSLVCAVGMAVFALNHFGLISVLFFGMFAFNNWKQLQGQPQVPWMMGR